MEEKYPPYTSATPSQLPLPHKHLNLKTTFLFVLVSMVINGLYLLEVMHALRPNGSENNGIVSLLFGMFLIIALLMAIYFSLGLFKKKTRSQSAKFLAASIFFLIFAAGTLKLSAHIRREAFSAFIERSAPPMQGIVVYQGRHMEVAEARAGMVNRLIRWNNLCPIFCRPFRQRAWAVALHMFTKSCLPMMINLPITGTITAIPGFFTCPSGLFR